MTSGPENEGTGNNTSSSSGCRESTDLQRVSEAVRELQRRTGYPLFQENGQRRYGPPPDWEGPAPPKGCEVFIGKIPRDLFEDELVPLMESAGKIYEVRIMMEQPGLNRGYGFVQYSTVGEAENALRNLNNYEIRPSKYLGVTKSVDNNRLFVGGIPKNRSREEVLEEMKRITEGVVQIILYPCVNDRSKNRGYAFVEYESHKAAAMARRRLFSGRILLWGTNEVKVDWAEPELMVDHDTMSKVKVIYIRNLSLSTTEENIRDLCVSFGGVERVKKQKDYAFVHFNTREQAEAAKASLNGRVVHGCDLEVTWAKPVKNREEYQQRKVLARSMVSARQPQPSLVSQISPTGEQVLMMQQIRRAAGAQGIQHPNPRGVSTRPKQNESHLLPFPAAPGMYLPQEYQAQSSGEILLDAMPQQKLGEPLYERAEPNLDSKSNEKLMLAMYPNGAYYFQPEKYSSSTVEESRASESARFIAANQVRGAQLGHYIVSPPMGMPPLIAPTVPATNPQNIAVPAAAYMVPSVPLTGYEGINPYAFYQPGLYMEKPRFPGTGE